MTRWKAASLDLLTVVIASGLLVLIARRWLERREQRQWPMAVGTVTGYEQRPGVKGRFTWLRGHYATGADTHQFAVVWGPSELGPGAEQPRAWIPPAGVPAVGATIPVHVDPRRPSVVALEDGPRVTSSLGMLAAAVVVLGLAVAIGISVWFM